MRYLIIPILWVLSLPYGLGIYIRNYLYDRGILKSIQFNVPVISIGNLRVGGTGKTPHVLFFIDLFLSFLI